jgi:hypothetical protein
MYFREKNLRIFLFFFLSLVSGCPEGKNVIYFQLKFGDSNNPRSIEFETRIWRNARNDSYHGKIHNILPEKSPI